MTREEALERLGNEKIVVKGYWKGTIRQKPQCNHLTTIKENFKNEYATLLQALERLKKLEKINEELKDYDILLFAKIFNYSMVIKEYLSYYPQLDKFEWNEKNNHYELTTNDGNYWVIDKKHYDLLMKLKEVLGE